VLRTSLCVAHYVAHYVELRFGDICSDVSKDYSVFILGIKQSKIEGGD